jgi:hypothetical protein
MKKITVTFVLTLLSLTGCKKPEENLADRVRALGSPGVSQAVDAASSIMSGRCSVDNVPPVLLISQKPALYMGDNPVCNNKAEYCQAVNNLIQRSATPDFYNGLIAMNQTMQAMSVVQICKLDMGAVKAAVCKNVLSVVHGDSRAVDVGGLEADPYNPMRNAAETQKFMDESCSDAGDAKAFREYVRRQECSRGYTAPTQGMIEECVRSRG